MATGEEFDWSALVPRIVHPLKVAIIEALQWIDTPLSSTDLRKVFGGDRFSLNLIAYHASQLAKLGAIRPVSSRQVRGATETFYSLAIHVPSTHSEAA